MRSVGLGTERFKPARPDPERSGRLRDLLEARDPEDRREERKSANAGKKL
jgi:hypothetical protein